MKKWIWIIVGVVAIAAVVVYAATRQNGKNDKTQSATGKIVKPFRGDLVVSITATGQIEPIDAVEIRSKASGEIIRLPIDDGVSVKKGDLIAQLDQTTAQNDYEQAKADFGVAEATLNQREKELNRVKGLFEKNLVSQQDLDNAQLAYEQARSQFVRTKTTLSTMEERLKDTVVRSPISGVVLQKNVEAGQIISSAVSSVSGGTLIATVAGMDKVYVVADVDETDIGKVAIGQGAKVVADAYPDEEFHGRVLKIAPLAKVAQNVTTFDVTAEVDNANHLLKAGMNANVDIVTAEARNALLVPVEALVEPAEAKMAMGNGAPGPGQSAEAQTKPPADAGGQTREISPERRERFRQMMESGQVTPEMMAQWQKRRAARRDTSAVNPEKPHARTKVVYVLEKGQPTPRKVTVGLSNLDNAQIVDGLTEQDEIVVQSSSQLMRDREEMKQRMQRFTGLPGVKKQ